MRYLVLNFIFSFTALFVNAADSKRLGDYVVSIKKSADGEIGNLVIRKNGKILFTETEIGQHYYWGDLSDSEFSQDNFSGKDINGNGVPDVVITKFTGGAHCCFYMYIFELGERLQKIAEIDGGSRHIRLVDLDRDKIPEIEFYEEVIAYQFASFADSPSGRVILKYLDGRYVVAPKLMSLDLPREQRLKSKLQQIKMDFSKRDNPGLPYSFLNLMVSWSYGGHFEDALKIATKLWPSSRPGLQKFKMDFTAALEESSYVFKETR